MLDIKAIQKNTDWFKEKLATRRVDPKKIDEVLIIDKKRRQCIQKTDELKSKRKSLEEKFFKEKSEEGLGVLKEVKKAIDVLEKELEKNQKEFDNLMHSFPNVPLDDVPVGDTDKVLREVGKKIRFDFKPVDYLTLAEKLNLIDVDTAGRVSGSRFGFIKNELVFLEFALVNYVYQKYCFKYMFEPILPPFFIKSEYFQGMGYVDTKEDKEETYYLENDDLFLIGTSEHIVGAMNAKHVFDLKELPKRFMSFSSCFRREAGSYGKDTKGILRSHQFDKIEMFSVCSKDQVIKEQDLFTLIEEQILKDLGIPYRVVQTSTLNISRPSARSFDMESFMPGQNEGKGEYRETHSNSNCTDFQARRLGIRYKNEKGEHEVAYTLNGTAIALGRLMIAIIENYQTKDGSIRIPKVLWPYMNGIKIISSKNAKTKKKIKLF